MSAAPHVRSCWAPSPTHEVWYDAAMHPRAIVGPPGTMPQLNPYNGMPQLRRTFPGDSYAQLAYGAGVHEIPTSSIQVDAPPIQANPERLGGIRMSLVKFNPGQTTGSLPNPMLQFGAGAPVQIPSSSIAVDPPPIQANPPKAGIFILKGGFICAGAWIVNDEFPEGELCGCCISVKTAEKGCDYGPVGPDVGEMLDSARNEYLQSGTIAGAPPKSGRLPPSRRQRRRRRTKAHATRTPRTTVRMNPASHEGGVTMPNPACHEGGVSVGACFPKFDPVQMYGAGQPPPMPNPVAAGAFPALDPSTGMPRLRGRIDRGVPRATMPIPSFR